MRFLHFVCGLSFLFAVAAASPASAQLAIGLEGPPDTVRPGEALSVQVTASNTGLAAVANVTVQLVFPAVMSSINQNYASAGGTCTGSGNFNANCDQGETITWTLGTLGPGARKTVSIPVYTPGVATAPNGTVLNLTARVLEAGVLRASAVETATVQSAPNFDLAVDESADPVAPGANLSYTLTFSNISAGNVANTSLTFALPAGTSFVSADGGGTFSAGVVTWGLGTLAPLQGGTRQVTVNVGAGVGEGALLRPVAQAQAPALLTARAAPITVVQSDTPLQLEIEATSNTLRSLQYTDILFVVTNVGGPTIDAVLELRMDQDLAAINQNYATHGGICTLSGTLNANCDPSERVQWDLPPLAAGERFTVSIPVGNGGPLNGSTIPIRAEVFEPLAGQVGESRLASETLRVQYAPAFDLQLDASDDPVAPGAELTYTATYSNVGTLSTVGTTLSVPVPAGTSFVSATDGGVFAAGAVSWNLGTLLPAAGGTREFKVQVGALAPEGQVLRAVARIGDTAASEVRAASLAVVQSGSPLRLEIEAGPNTLRTSEYSQVLITVTNTGATTIDPLLELHRSSEVTAIHQNYTTHDGICTVSGTLNAICDAIERVQWNLEPLAAGDHITVSFPIGVGTPGDGRLIPLRAEVYEPLALATGESRIARQTMRVQYARTFQLQLDESDDPVAPGANLTYTAIFANVSAASTNGTTLSVPLPAGTSFVSATGGGVNAAGAVTWNLGTVAAGTGGTRQFTVNVGALADGLVLRTTAKIQDSAANTARAPSVAAVQTGSPLRLEIEAGPNPMRNLEYAEVVLTVSNIGGATIDPVLELGIGEYVSAINQNYTSRGGDCTVAGTLNVSCDPIERVHWDLAPLAPGERITVSVPLGIGAPPNGTLIPVRAEVFEDLVGTTGENRQLREAIRVQYARPFELALDESDDPVAPGASLTYTATYSNVSGASTNGTTLSVPLPAGTSFVSATGGGTLTSGVVSWNLGTLPAAQFGTRRFTVNVGALPEGSVLRAFAQIQDSGVNAARATSVAVVQSGSPLRLEIEPAPDPLRNSQYADVQLTVTNVGGSTIDPMLEVRRGENVTVLNQNYMTRGGNCLSSGTLNANCDPLERVQWDLPPLAAGERVTVSMPVGIASPLSGTLIPIRAEVYEPLVGVNGKSRHAKREIAVQFNPPTFELALDESVDPVAPGANLVYTITLGKVSAVTSALPVLSFQIPAGTTFVSATNGGTASNGVVSWFLPPLPAGQTGTRQVTVTVDPGLAQGTPIRASAQISDFAGYIGRANAVTVAQSGSVAPLRLVASATPDPARPTNTLNVQLQVTNLTGNVVQAPLVEARVPPFIATFAQASASAGASCVESGTLNTNCDAIERVRWQLPDLAPFASTIVSMPPVVIAGTANGTLVRFFATVDAGAPQSVAKDTVRIGFLDSDGDGLLDTFDNCGAVANADQADGDVDESGDLCDACPTITNANQSDVDFDLVGDVCDNCVSIANARVAAGFLAANPWATLTGGQRDDDHDGFGNRCDADFTPTGVLVGPADLTQFRGSNGKNRTGDTCGAAPLSTVQACAIYDLDETGLLLGPGDLTQFRALSGKVPGPKCATCPLTCTAGATGSCF